MYTTLTLRLFHIIFMATWAGAALFASGDIKRTILEPKSHTPLLLDRMNRYKRLAFVSAFGTILTGFGVVWSMGGMAAVPRGIHFGIASTFILFAIGAGGLGRTTQAIADGIEAGQSAEQLSPLVKRMGMATGLFHTMWLVTLVLMVFRHVV